MTVVVVTAPEPAIDLDLVKAHLRVDGGDDDDLIEAFIAAAVSHIDGPQGWLGRSLWPQTLELRLDGFCGPIRLPYGPVQSVLSIKSVDAAGVEQTMSSADYLLTAAGEVVLAHGCAWPNVRGDVEGVRVRYVAGFATLPPAVLSAVLLMIGDLYSQRESAVVGTISAKAQMSASVEALLSPFRSFLS